jgi:hypothetical protein
MRSRIEIQDAFVTRFRSDTLYDRAPVTVGQLDDIEVKLNTKLPAAYRDFMLRHGAVYTPSILSEIVDNNLDHPDMKEFFEPHEVIRDTKLCWSGGMPDNVIGIASDCMGNIFGFDRHRSPSDDSPVIFFDHDFVEVYEVAPSFDELLNWYLGHL